MLETLKFSSVITSLSSAAGWLDLSLTLFCVAVALIFSRYWCRYSGLIQEKTDGALLLRQALTRIVFPASAFVFILLTRSLFHLYAEPLFLNIALPLTIAFLVIRLMAYTLRSLFPRSMWLTASERAIAFSVWSLVALHFMGVLPEIIEELDSLVLPFGKGVSVWALLKGIIVVSFTASVAIWFSDLIEQRVLSQELGKNASYGGWLFFVRFIRVMLLFIAVMLALQGIGIDLTVFAVFGGAIGVGIGLGLQKIVANYIAGFAILAERSVNIGDMVTVGSQFGIVKQVAARYIVVQSLDGVDALIPNETFLTQTVLNHSSNQRAARVLLTIQVGYGTDLRLAMRLMRQAANEQPRVIDGGNAPRVDVAGFGDNGINLNLVFWVCDPENGQGVLKSDINLRMWDLFIEHDIEVPFPQREIRILNNRDEGNTSFPPGRKREEGQP